MVNSSTPMLPTVTLMCCIADEDYWPLITDLTRTLGEEENGVYPIYASKKEIEQGACAVIHV
ncbi:MAG: hypothetical protein RR087_09945 [Oscillospiraceae bacterium]